MNTFFIVAGVVYQNGKLLILQRRKERKNYPTKWEFICGYNKDFETIEKSILREVKEETSCDGEIEKVGRIVRVVDGEITWLVAPFLISLYNLNIRIDHEHSDFRWIEIHELENFDCVPGIFDDLRALDLV